MKDLVFVIAIGVLEGSLAFLKQTVWACLQSCVISGHQGDDYMKQQ